MTHLPDPIDSTIAGHMERSGVDRRHFLTFCGKLMAAAPFGLAITNALSVEAVAAGLAATRRPSVIWLHFQECTGCTETLLRTSHPDLADLLFNIISLDYHETVMAASGYDAEAALHDAMDENDGKFVLVVEGAIPTKENGRYLTIAGKTGMQILEEVSSRAAAVISIGSCASFGGIPASGPNPTGSVGVDTLVTTKPVVNIPGCPPNPYVLLGVVLQYASNGTLPELDDKNRPKFAYDRVIHEHCPRRPHFDAGRFAAQFGDSGHNQGWCLYKLGCKGPVTHAPCSTRHFNEVVDCWPIGIGHPCVGCTEQEVAFRIPIHETAEIFRPVPPATYPGIYGQAAAISPVATGVAGLIGGAAIAGGILASRKLGTRTPPEDDGSLED
ncbi:MAG: hydrogenase small subunit [Thermoanaerobaculia bacterium]